jgi:nitrite reductase [NAD(P)H] small subunit
MYPKAYRWAPLIRSRAAKAPLCGGEKQIAVFRTRAGEVFATQARCPHLSGPLADGLVGEATVICPLHERAFDLRTGAGIGGEDCLRLFPLRVSEQGTMSVSMD